MSAQRLTRRRLMAGGAGLSAAAWLAACGTETGGRRTSAEVVERDADRRRADLLQLAALHRGGPQHARALPTALRHAREVRRGDQRQPGVLRQGAPAVRARGLRRPRPARRHRLDGRAHDPPRLRAEARQARAAERRGQPDRPAARAVGRPRARVHRPVAVGHDRPDLPQGQGQARAAQHRGPLRPRLQGQGHAAERGLRHRADDHARPGRRPGERHARPDAGRRREGRGRDARPARCAASPATSTRRTSPRATRG